MTPPPDARRRLGRIFVGLALLLFAAAGLFGAGLAPMAPGGRAIVAGVLALAGIVQTVVGVTLIRGARQ